MVAQDGPLRERRHPENAFLVTDALVFSSERDRAMELLAYR